MHSSAVFLLFLAASTQTFASTWFVSTSGSDANDGSLETPWQSLTFAVSQAGQKDLISLLPGVYAGAANANLNISVDLDFESQAGPGTVLLSQHSGAVGFKVFASVLTLEGLDFEGFHSVVSNQDGSIRVLSCNFTNMDIGLDLSHSPARKVSFVESNADTVKYLVNSQGQGHSNGPLNEVLIKNVTGRHTSLGHAAYRFQDANFSSTQVFMIGGSVQNSVFEDVNFKLEMLAPILMNHTLFNANKGIGHAISAGPGLLELVDVHFDGINDTACSFTSTFVSLKASSFYDCGKSGSNGGAIALFDQASANIDDCFFQGNRAQSGSCVHCSHSETVVTNSIFYGNSAANTGAVASCANCVFIEHDNTYAENDSKFPSNCF